MARTEPTTIDALFVILVSPNVSEQMGGEAIKALQIYLELSRRGVSVHQITHERVKPELDRKFPEMSVSYVRDTWFQKTVYRVRPLAPFLNLIFLWRAGQQIAGIVGKKSGVVVHFTSPVSPVLPYFSVRGAAVIIGPVNGNIHYPPAFRSRETTSYRVRRWLHPVMQFMHRLFFSGKQSADALLVAGGPRTYQSLRMAGCRDNQFVDSIDSGVLDNLYQKSRISHSGRNLRFFQNGRLVKHKGTDLVIRCLARTKNPVELDVIGRGPELESLKALVAELCLQDRVRFIEWIAEHSKLAEMLREYRAFVFPSLAEANGIVVQEAMVQGLPVIALNWGGPSLLVTPETGVLIEPLGEEYVIDELARSLDRLAEDGNLAETMSIAGRQRAVANGFLWSGIIGDWTRVYERAFLAREERVRVFPRHRRKLFAYFQRNHE
jgi:glycosyltransferase involved in cell wall biosynthesis